MFDASWHNEHLAGVQRHLTVTEVDSQLPVDDKERFVRVRMAVPNEVAFEFDEFEMEASISAMIFGDH